jgi:hypothetical protein
MQRSGGSWFEATPKQIVCETLSPKIASTKQGWRNAFLTSLASVRPWVQAPVIPKKKKKKKKSGV